MQIYLHFSSLDQQGCQTITNSPIWCKSEMCILKFTVQFFFIYMSNDCASFCYMKFCCQAAMLDYVFSLIRNCRIGMNLVSEVKTSPWATCSVRKQELYIVYKYCIQLFKWDIMMQNFICWSSTLLNSCCIHHSLCQGWCVRFYHCQL